MDWRAPVANAYYENGLGECSYCAPDGRELPIRLDLKRTYEIDQGKLLDYFDTEVIANDELLTKYLAKINRQFLAKLLRRSRRNRTTSSVKRRITTSLYRVLPDPERQP